jgi:catechol 2,3-dioxygenase-like lactoylglutathione lyase family enzyme
MREPTPLAAPVGDYVIADMIPFIFVSDVARSTPFYQGLGFEVIDTHESHGRIDFASLRASDSAKIMLARTHDSNGGRVSGPTPGFLYLYARNLDALRKRLIELGFDPGEIEDGSPGPSREMRVTDPDGHRHMVAELSKETVASRESNG